MRRTSLCAVALATALLALPSAASATWSRLTPVDPSGAVNSQLGGVACTSSTNCEAVGNSDGAALIERWNGTSWATQTAATPPAGTVSHGLVGVGCSSSSACTAVGSYDDGSSTWALAERWTTSWALQAIPRPAGATTSQLSGVTCVTSTFCLAVGSYVDAGGSQPFALRWNGTSWSQLTVPTVSGSTGTALSAVSCASTTACTVVGSYLDGNGFPLPTAASYNGTSWTLQTVPTPRNAAATFISGLSCTSSSACTTVGYATDVNGSLFAVAERWNGTSWSEQTLAAVPSGATGSALLGVSCTSSTFCNAVGYYIDRAGLQRTYSQTWTPWAVAATVDPTTFDAAALTGIACTSSTACVGVGYSYGSSFSETHTLAQRWS